MSRDEWDVILATVLVTAYVGVVFILMAASL